MLVLPVMKTVNLSFTENQDKTSKGNIMSMAGLMIRIFYCL